MVTTGRSPSPLFKRGPHLIRGHLGISLCRLRRFVERIKHTAYRESTNAIDFLMNGRNDHTSDA
jgi:hypothetical protein